MLKQRVLSALVLFPLLMWAILSADKSVWAILIAVFVSLSIYECAKMLVPALERKCAPETFVEKNIGIFPHWVVASMIFGLMLLYSLLFLSAEPAIAGAVIGVLLVAAMAYGVFTASSIEMSVARLIGIVMSVAYGCLPWISVWELFEMGDSGRYLIYLIFLVAASDTGAYFGGKAFGKRKLAPNLSPNKTWEGLFFGLASAIVFGNLANYLFDMSLGSVLSISVIAMIGAVAGIVGDLVESGFKRFSGVKDSGKIIPGHGGFLDRVDAILFASPVVWFSFIIVSMI